jgi:DNA replication and repair protein RecF
MRITALEVRDFRNLASISLEPGARFNLVHGDNAQGKTNLLEALYLLAFLKSFRTRRAQDLIRWGCDEARLAATVEASGVSSHVTLSLRKGERVLEVDGKRARSVMAYYGLLTCVLFGPGDLDLTKGSPDVRRRYLDRILFLSDRGYWATLKGYGEALAARNKLLQQGESDRALFRSFDRQLADFGCAILRRRREVLRSVELMAGRLLGELAAWESEGLKLWYDATLEGDSPTSEDYLKTLEARLNGDLRRGFTSVGPHLDDLSLRFGNGRDFRRFASQGQHRLASILLKLTEMEVLRQATGAWPVLLLDDVSSELDRRHYGMFKAYLERGGDQVFLSTTDREVLPAGPDIHYYRVTQGRVEADP